MPLKPALIALLLAAAPAALCAAEIGRMEPAPPLTRAHIMADAPAAERAAWLAYLERSEAFARAEKASMFAERVGMSAVPAAPATGNPDESMPTDRPAAWYAGPEAKAVAANILSFQSPTGGWSKNQDRRTPPRVKGQYYVAGEAGESWSNWGTFDNGATQKELAFLARVQAQYPGPEGDAYRAAFLKGVTYILVSQYPNGAWPQIYPLMGGYHDALTYNDDAFANQATVCLFASAIFCVAGTLLHPARTPGTDADPVTFWDSRDTLSAGLGSRWYSSVILWAGLLLVLTLACMMIFSQLFFPTRLS